MQIINVYYIPEILGLQTLDCEHCTSLINIPDIKGLKNLKCDCCVSLIIVPNIKKYDSFSCYGCKWLRPINKYFRNDLKKVKKIQKCVKRTLLSNRLINMIPKIMPLYYHPDAKGGYFDKKELFNFFQNVKKLN